MTCGEQVEGGEELCPDGELVHSPSLLPADVQLEHVGELVFWDDELSDIVPLFPFAVHVVVDGQLPELIVKEVLQGVAAACFTVIVLDVVAVLPDTLVAVQFIVYVPADKLFVFVISDLPVETHEIFPV